MPQYTFQFRGWQGVIALVLLLDYCGVSASLPVRSTDNGMREAIREYLLDEYSGRSLSDVQRILSEASAGQAVESLPEAQKYDVESSSISALGKFMAEYERVRVQITVDGSLPPKGPALRYFRMKHTLSGKRLVLGQSDATSTKNLALVALPLGILLRVLSDAARVLLRFALRRGGCELFVGKTHRQSWITAHLVAGGRYKWFR